MKKRVGSLGTMEVINSRLTRRIERSQCNSGQPKSKVPQSSKEEEIRRNREAYAISFCLSSF